MKQDNDYIIKGGSEGKARLDVLGSILDTHTIKLLEQGERLDGKKFLDLGCGGGNMSRNAARLVGDKGNVTAIDFDAEILSLAQKQAGEEGIRNISFRSMDAYELDYDSTFDIVYSRFLLSHLTDPAKVLSNMLRALRPGGRLLIEDIDFSGHFCFPPSKGFDLYLHYFTTAARNNHQNPDIGLSLFKLFNDAGVGNVQYDVIQPVHNTGAGKWMAYYTMDKIKDAVIKQNLATSDEIKEVLKTLSSLQKTKPLSSACPGYSVSGV